MSSATMALLRLPGCSSAFSSHSWVSLQFRLCSLTALTLLNNLFIEVQLIYHVTLVSDAEHRDSIFL